MNKLTPFSSRLHFSQKSRQGVVSILLLFILMGNIFYFGFKTHELFVLRSEDSESKIQKLMLVQKILEDNYLFSEEVPSDQVYEGAIEGMVYSMGDPYTRYYTEKEYEEFKIQTSGQFGGIGVTVDSSTPTDKGIIITDTLKGNGAELAGLKPNDRIIAVNGEEINGMPLSDAIALIRGEVGTDVQLTIIREGETEPITVIVKRGTVEVPVVSHRMLDKEVGYIHYASFSETSINQFDEAVKELQGENMKGLILDLRDNPGGLVSASVDLSSRMLDKDKTVVQVTSKTHTSETKTVEAPYQIDVPIVVLVNERSASASEILTGALKDNDRAVVVGTRTFGKGLIQSRFPLTDDSALIITISQYKTPVGIQIHGKGITPDVEVEVNREDFLKGIDNQLEKSIEEMEKLLH